MPNLKYNYYRFVPGDEKFPISLYDDIASKVQDSDIICEIGCFMGRTTALMTELLDHYNKSPKFYAIDMFGAYLPDGDVEPLAGNMPWGEPLHKWANRSGGTQMLIDHFDFYLSNCPTANKITDRVQFPPWHSSEEFDDESVFFVMLNASRNPELIQMQLEKWWPKIKKGGTLALYNSDISEIFAVAYNFQKVGKNFSYSNNVVTYKNE
jgi:hypothetical protein